MLDGVGVVECFDQRAFSVIAVLGLHHRRPQRSDGLSVQQFIILDTLAQGFKISAQPCKFRSVGFGR